MIKLCNVSSGIQVYAKKGKRRSGGADYVEQRHKSTVFNVVLLGYQKSREVNILLQIEITKCDRRAIRAPPVAPPLCRPVWGLGRKHHTIVSTDKHT
ncbi:unnamed protein product [Arctia plantaginis]|uniref:Uncharacterized protein n=1 Tax=Arctia plantaginis TaxID=874455 RepID=A0A8S0YPF4_ARCPL|nr:unnamed protein product [Arctia plantaginis]